MYRVRHVLCIKIEQRQILPGLPEQEVTKYFYRRKTHYRNRIEKELQPKPEMQDKDSQTQKEQGAGSQ